MKIEYVNFGDQTVNLSNLNIIIGTNGSGKTTLLKDLYMEFLGHVRESPKWENLLIDENNAGGSFVYQEGEFTQWLESLEPVENQFPARTDAYMDPLSAYKLQNKIGILAEVPSQLYTQTKVKSYSSLKDDAALYRELERHYKLQRTAFLEVDDRTFLANDQWTGTYGMNLGEDLKAVTFLAHHKKVLDRMNEKFEELFGKKIFCIQKENVYNWALYVGPSGGKIGVPDPVLATAEELEGVARRSSGWVTENKDVLCPLNEEGHGVRATFGILYELENPVNKIVFIDEPELHLYPTAKWSLGKYIGDYAGQRDKQIILVTHDSDFLRGALQISGEEPTLIRLDSDRKVYSVIGSKIIKKIGSEIIPALFSDSSIIVEGIADQYVYGAVSKETSVSGNKSPYFVPVGGKNNAGNYVEFFNGLGIKYAFILDFDSIVPKANNEKSVAVSLLDKINVPPEKREKISENICELRKKLKGKSKKEKGGHAEDLEEDEKSKEDKILSELKDIGIFVVPIGDLEDWVDEEKGCGPERVLEKYLQNKEINSNQDVDNFITHIQKYIYD